MQEYTEKFGLPQEDAELIIADRAFSDFYNAAAASCPEYREIANLMLGALNRCLNESGKTVEQLQFTPAELAELAQLSADGTISKNTARDILVILFAEGGKPRQIAEKNNWIMQNDTDGIEKIVDEVLAQNAGCVSDYKNGNQKVFGFLMGQANRALKGSATPKAIKELLEKKLKG